MVQDQQTGKAAKGQGRAVMRFAGKVGEKQGVEKLTKLGESITHRNGEGRPPASYTLL